MPPDFPTQLWSSLAATGPVALILAIGIWHQTKSNQSLVTQLNSERSDRIDTLEAHVKACDADRHDLRVELLRLAMLSTSNAALFPHDPPTRHNPTAPL